MTLAPLLSKRRHAVSALNFAARTRGVHICEDHPLVIPTSEWDKRVASNAIIHNATPNIRPLGRNLPRICTTQLEGCTDSHVRGGLRACYTVQFFQQPQRNGVAEEFHGVTDTSATCNAGLVVVARNIARSRIAATCNRVHNPPPPPQQFATQLLGGRACAFLSFSLKAFPTQIVISCSFCNCNKTTLLRCPFIPRKTENRRGHKQICFLIWF